MHIFDIVCDERERNFALTCLRGLLYGLSVVYGVLVWHRAMAYRIGLFKSYDLDSYVVSIGNITVGGTGKTPLVITLARALIQEGYRVVILSRGYKGTAKGICLVSDGQNVLVSKEVAGDEPYMLAQKVPGVPIIVGKNRYAAGRVAVQRFAPEVILLDDGYQHLKLKRDLDIVVVDSMAPFGKGNLLPRGSLREPFSALKRAGLFCLTHLDQCTQPDRVRQRLRSIQPRVPMLEGRHRPVALRPLAAPTKDMGIAYLKGKAVLAFSGIGNPESFYRMLEDLGCRVAARASFPDHYVYPLEDLKTTVHQARNLKVDCIVTTAKDAVRFPESWRPDLPILILEITLEMAGMDHILERIASGHQAESV